MPYFVKRALKPKTAKPAPIEQPIYPRGIEDMTQKIDASIADANGRYVLNEPLPKPKPSGCWIVVSPKTPAINEAVKVFFRAGRKKLKIMASENKAGEIVIGTEKTIKASKLIEELNDMRLWVQKMGATKRGKDYEELHEALKQAYKPNANYAFDEKEQVWKRKGKK
ncbi:hypothetical protein N9O33_04625 [Gammaproteobacteria bacterium]|nr:hypothetical protein [Gammaproteobacteria bacterium]